MQNRRKRPTTPPTQELLSDCSLLAETPPRLVAKPTSQSNPRWILDSGASEPVSSRRDWYVAYHPFDKPSRVYLGDKRYIHAYGKGQIVLDVNLGSDNRQLATLQDVYYVPRLDGNLLSVAASVTPRTSSSPQESKKAGFSF
jgi:hypothetical protein